MSTEADIVDYLKEYHNKESKAIKGRSLCELFNLHSKQVRNLVSVLRQDGEPICSSNNGYWYSNDPEDLDRTIKRLSEQVKNMSRAVDGLYRAKEGLGNE
jgi:transcriptional regulator of NAD metabolism